MSTFKFVKRRDAMQSLRGALRKCRRSGTCPMLQIDALEHSGILILKIPLEWYQQVLPKKPKSYLLGNHLLKRTQGLIPVRQLIVYGDHITEKYSRFKRTREQ